MPKKSFSHRECLEGCHSVQHANELIAAVTLSHSKVTDKQLASYLKNKCFSFHSVQDELGRKVLHMAASCGRKELCQWLIKCSFSCIDDQDEESGYTPLHRAVLYGHINVAVTLIKLGACGNIMDREDFTPIDLVLKSFDNYCIDSLFQTKCQTGEKSVSSEYYCKLAAEKRNFLAASSSAFATEVYTWGTNQNYTLGFGTESKKASPECLEFFDKKNEIIIDIQMQKYHTLFLSSDGNVWGCGLGHGGRLGLSSESTVLIPQRVPLISKVPAQNTKSLFCIKVAVGADHSIFMCNDNQILTCGLNTYHQLGISPPPVAVYTPQPVEIISCLNDIRGIAASTFHSVVWTGTTVFACGLHAGQLGLPHSIEKTVPSFQKVQHLDFDFTNISNVAVSDAATVIVTDAHDIYLLSGYKMEKMDFRRIIARESIDVTGSIRSNGTRTVNYAGSEAVLKVVVYGGELDAEKVKSLNSSYRPEVLTIAVLLSNGSVFLKKKNCTQFLKCEFLKKHEIKISDVHLNSGGMLLCSYKGIGFSAKVQGLVKTFGKAKDGFVKVNHRCKEEINECYLIKLTAIPNAYRSTRVSSEPNNSNFALLQIRSSDVPKNWPDFCAEPIESDIKNFYLDSCDSDPFTDITFKIGKKTFAAHKYIVASCSESLLSDESGGFVIVNDVHVDIFEQLLLYIYSGTCSLLQEGPCFIKVPKMCNDRHSINKTSKDFEDPLKLSIKAAQKFKMAEYVKALQYFRYENEYIHSSFHPLPKKRLRFNRNDFKLFYDIRLKSQDNKQVFHAHKCILAARVEYFRSMLSGYWIESSSMHHEHQLHVTSPVLSEMLEFIYTDAVTKFVHKKDLKFWCSFLVAADQFILPKLKEICEYSVAQCLDTRNVCDVLLFADTINARFLKKACYEFISINLSSLLYSRLLDGLSDNLLNELTDYYRNQFRVIDRTFKCPLNIPVYRNACNHTEVINAESICPVDWEIINDDPFSENLTEQKPLKIIQKKKKKSFRSASTLKTENEYLPIAVKPIDENANSSCAKSAMSVETSEKNSTTSQWVTVNKHLKSVQARLRANAVARSCPQLIEQKENFTPLSTGKVFLESPSTVKNNDDVNDESPRNRLYSIEIDFQNISPKLSQKQRRKLRKSSESEKFQELQLSPQKKEWDEKLSPPAADSFIPASASCWTSRSAAGEAVNFSAIVASEKKQKTKVQKEIRKLETKPLHFTQIEDQAIEELISLYAAKCDEECVTVQRVIFRAAAPRWVK